MKFGKNYMSRIGKKPIGIPEGIDVKIEGQKVIVKGPKGELSMEIRPEIKIELKDKEISFSLRAAGNGALWGLMRTLVANMIKGVTEGYQKQLEIEGIGFKANMEGNNLVLNVGFSHPVKIAAPEGIKFLVEKNTVTVSGADKELVGNLAAKIRKVKPPEPYKGKGIRYAGERIRRKLGKKAVATAT